MAFAAALLLSGAARANGESPLAAATEPAPHYYIDGPGTSGGGSATASGQTLQERWEIVVQAREAFRESPVELVRAGYAEVSLRVPPSGGEAVEGLDAVWRTPIRADLRVCRARERWRPEQELEAP